MPRLFPSPLLADYFVTYVFDEEARRTGAHDAAIRRDYEAGKCVILKGWRLDYDAGFFASLDLIPNRTAKKLKSRVDPAGRFDLRELNDNLKACARDEQTPPLFVEQAKQIAAQVSPQIERIFAGQEFYERRLTWRMLETVIENLHVDFYDGPRTNHLVRLFMNLDSVPRIWHTGYRVPEMLARYGHLLADEEVRDYSAELLIKTLNIKVFGDVDRSGHDGHPRHIALFDPGDIWLVDSRKVSHQIYYGRRAVSVDFVTNPTTMADPEQFYLRAVEAYQRDRIG